MSRRWGSKTLIAAVLDQGSFQSWDEPGIPAGISQEYADTLAAAAESSGVDESIVTGQGLIQGRPVAVVVNEFSFLAGSIGQTSARRIVTAIRRATELGLPVLGSTSSGGTRMQEGTPAFVQMMEIARAVMDHKAAGLPYLVHLRNPTTGGVFASWGSLGQITVADPGSLVGFLGPKVHEILNGVRLPKHIQSGEHLAESGIIDAVVEVEQLSALISDVLTVVTEEPGASTLIRRVGDLREELTAWDAITATRANDRISVRDVLRAGGKNTIILSGTEAGERDPSILVALTRIDGEPCIVVGQDRTRQTPTAPMGPGALRQARRAMGLAEEWSIPLITVIDTPGADISAAAEEGAIAGEIARCLGTLSTLKVPSVAVLLGQGCGGGAIALLPAQRVIAAERAWLTPLPPEGASAIVYGDTDHAAQMAEAQQVRAIDLLRNGTVHSVVPEPDGDTGTELALAIAAEIAHTIRELRADAAK